MNVLLLLSALMSAIAGLSSAGQRTPVAAERVLPSANAVVARVAALPAAARHFGAAFDACAARQTPMPLLRILLAVVALYAGRLRE